MDCICFWMDEGVCLSSMASTQQLLVSHFCLSRIAFADSDSHGIGSALVLVFNSQVAIPFDSSNSTMTPAAILSSEYVETIHFRICS